jgi:hypothetical protein
MLEPAHERRDGGRAGGVAGAVLARGPPQGRARAPLRRRRPLPCCRASTLRRRCFFLVGGAIGLAAHAPDLAAGFFLAPRIGAITHQFTMGWITTSIMGALYQFLPVALDRPIRSVPTGACDVPAPRTGAAHVHCRAGQRAARAHADGAAVMGTGTLLFCGNLAATLASATRRDVTWWALALATVFLAHHPGLGVALAGNLRWGFLGGGRLAALGVHLHVALAGWVLLVMIGVGHRLLPMFLLSHGASDRWAKAAVALVSRRRRHAGAAAPRPRAGEPLAAGAAHCRRLRGIPAAGPGVLRHPAPSGAGRGDAAGGCIAGAAGVGAAAGMAGPVRRTLGSVAVAYVLAIILAITLFIVAHYYRIVPFLVWYHRFGPLAGRQPIPQVHDLYSARLAHAAGAR